MDTDVMVSCRRRLLLVAWMIAGLLVMLALGLAGAGPADARAPLAQCEDGVDNDGDGKIDAPFDPGCPNAGNNSEINPPTAPQCSNGGADFPFHPQCSAAGDNNEQAGTLTPCSNDVDDAPTDGVKDYPADPKCLWAADPNEVERLCSNGKDDDGDGFRDFPGDIGCANHNDNNETNLPQCDDGRDNDGDGTVDFEADSDCDSPTDTVEGPPLQPPHCSDSIDNDGDGKADFPNDPGCAFAGDNDETDPPPPPPALCADGLDNEGDGRIDFPADPGCGSESDEDETDTVVYVLPQGQLTPPRPPPAAAAPTRLLTPFPIVRLRGRADRKGVRVTLLTVRAPARSTVSIYCSSASCPRRRVALSGGKKLVRVKQFERRLRGGTILKVYVTRPGFVGKYTRFRFTSNRVPLRTDRCATTPGKAPLSCPSS